MARVYKKNNGKWYFSLEIGTIDGKRKRLNRLGGKTKKECEKKLRQVINEFEDAGFHKDVSNITFSDYLDYFIENYMKINLRETTFKNRITMIDKHFKKDLGGYKLKNISPIVLNGFINNKVKAGYKKSYIGQIYSYMKLIFRYAVHPTNFIKLNPAEHIEMPRMEENSKKIQVLSDAELMTLFKEFKKTEYEIAFIIAFHTGARLGEVMGLKWDCVNIEEKYIMIERSLYSVGKQKYIFTKPKNKSSERKIIIGETLINHLKEHKKNQLKLKFMCGRYFENNNLVVARHDGKIISPLTLKRYCSSLSNRLGFQFNFHMLRHTHATMLLESGANIKNIQARLGHANISVTLDTYSHVTKKMETETVDILEKRVKNF
ncbi:tyrosine-type recombinase/integrase [Psychrilyobacter sp.]|uniref:tyrosine-type recombinase/integrase n=1 Tax=Psychrilyobacter sp. TaxID=2586924 RepID=UPI0030178FD2